MPYVGKKPADIIATAVDTTTGTFSGDLTVDTSTLYVDSANNRVGVGTTSASQKLTISGGNVVVDDGQAFSWGDNSYRIEGKDDGANARIGFVAADTERMRITSAGSVGIGITNPASLLHLKSSTADVRLQLTNSASANDTTGSGASFQLNNDDLYINAVENSGDIVFRTDGGTGGFAERMRIDASGKVGLGIDPSTLPSFISHAMKIANGGGLSITSPSSGDNRYIFFGTGTSSADVQLAAIKNSSSELMFLGASGSEKMRIDSSGNLLVGKTAISVAAVGVEARADGIFASTRSGGESIRANRTSSDGDIIQLRKDNTTVANIGVSGGNNPYFSSAVANHGGLVFSDGGSSTPQMNPISSGSTLVDNAMNIGSASYRFKDLYLGGGAYIGGTGSANYLDDYEEGTFTATLEGSTTNPNTPVTLSSARYTKIGRQVMVQGQFTNVDTTGAAGGVRVTGLPFTASTAFASGNVMTYVRFTLGTTSTNISPYVSGTQIAFYQSTTGAGWGEIAHSAGTGAYLAWTAIYDTNS